ncbi:hypothetical protein [Actinospica robiniae]|uniref:hypothetical protein n=1 Tax=Actinospica robiniae TaxID=304901 RepID=UPI0003FD6AE8|nr:hypothetical protein [Actinospica robiniae]
MTTSRTAPFPPVVSRAQLGPLGVPIGSPGQCKAVYPLLGKPGYLFKEYRPTQLKPADPLRLDRLVRLPGQMTTADRELLEQSVSWPVARVVEGATTVGVVIPTAPRQVYAKIVDAYGEAADVPLVLTHLASQDDQLARKGLAAPSLAQRLTLCGGLIDVGDLFERHSLVYGDWGYKNIFWSAERLSVYFIDTDACSFGPQPWVESYGFEDLQTRQGQMVDTYTDRFRCAIAVAACLTGDRNQHKAMGALGGLMHDERVQRIAPVLRCIVEARSRTTRPAIAEVRGALRGTTQGTTLSAGPLSSTIVGWDPVEPPPRRKPAPPRRSPPARSSPRPPTEPTVPIPPARVYGGSAPSSAPTRSSTGSAPSLQAAGGAGETRQPLPPLTRGESAIAAAVGLFLLGVLIGIILLIIHFV